MSRVVTHNETLTVNFSALDDDHSYYSISGTSNAYKGTGSSSSYCTIDPSRGNNAETWFYFKFDTSSIPANATITSVSCSVRNWMASGVTGANRFTSVYMTMASGTTEKGTAIDIKSNYSNTARTFTAGTWTLSEVQDVRVKFYAQRGTANASTSYAMRVYGGTLTIEYSYDETLYTVTATSNTGSITVSPASQEYSAGSNATVSITGDITDAQITDNSTDVKSSLSGTSPNYTYTISSIAADHAFVVYVEATGPTVFYKSNGSWVQAEKVFYKTNGSWVEVESMSVKDNGAWRT